MSTLILNELFLQCQSDLQKAGIEDYEFESLTLIRHFFQLSQNEWLLKRSQPASEEMIPAFLEAVQDRAERRPLQYILGTWDFMDLEISVGEGVLIPRADTEILVNTVSNWLNGKDEQCGIDLCAGSGAVSLGLCSLHPDLQMTAVELSSTAFSFLVENLDNYAELDIMPLEGDILDETLSNGFTGSLDFIASNPPYIESDALDTLQEEVQCEPAMALNGGEDGLFFYREITEKWTKCLKTGGLLAFEIGETQAKTVSELLAAQGFSGITVYQDLSGLDRVVSGIKL